MNYFFQVFSKTLGFLLAIMFLVILISLFLLFFAENKQKYFSYLKGNKDSSEIIAILNLNGPIISEPPNFNNYNGIIFNGIQYYMSAAETHEYWATANNCVANPTMTTIANTNTSDGSSVERYTWIDASGCTYVEHLKVINGGHDWPGAFGNMDIDASQEIWSFVSNLTAKRL